MFKFKNLILNVIATKFAFLHQNNLVPVLPIYICSRTSLIRTKLELCLFGLQKIRINRNSNKNRKEDAGIKYSILNLILSDLAFYSVIRCGNQL